MSISKIEWLNRVVDGRPIEGYTFNPWWGCVQVSEACDHCYAATWATRCGMDIWGYGGRRFFGEAHWNEPMKWQREAAEAKEQRLVFCGSMCDIGEDRRDLDIHREQVFDLAERTPDLTWLFLTKRPVEFTRLVRWRRRWPHNTAFGVTVESAAYLWRIEEALKADAPLHFVSYEPALGPVDFRPYLGNRRGTVRWLIYGVENSTHARPADHALGESVVEQCRERGASPFIKQLDAGLLKLGRHGRPIKDPASFPASLRVREWPDFGGPR